MKSHITIDTLFNDPPGGINLKAETYFHVEQDRDEVSQTNKHRIYFSNYVIHRGWIKHFLPGPRDTGVSKGINIADTCAHSNHDFIRLHNKYFNVSVA